MLAQCRTIFLGRAPTGTGQAKVVSAGDRSKWPPTRFRKTVETAPPPRRTHPPSPAHPSHRLGQCSRTKQRSRDGLPAELVDGHDGRASVLPGSSAWTEGTPRFWPPGSITWNRLHAPPRCIGLATDRHGAAGVAFDGDLDRDALDAPAAPRGQTGRRGFDLRRVVCYRPSRTRRGGRAAECAGFENRLTERLREFESPLLRFSPTPVANASPACICDRRLF